MLKLNLKQKENLVLYIIISIISIFSFLIFISAFINLKFFIAFSFLFLLVVFIYYIYLANSYKTYTSIPFKIENFLNSNNYGQVIKIKLISKNIYSNGIKQSVIVRNFLTDKNISLVIKEKYDYLHYDFKLINKDTY